MIIADTDADARRLLQNMLWELGLSAGLAMTGLSYTINT